MKPSRTRLALIFFLFVLGFALGLPQQKVFAQSSNRVREGKPDAPENYSPKNGVLNLKAIILGGGYRVTNIIPLQGDFSRYGHLELVQAESLIGKDAPLELLSKLGKELKGAFEKGGRFSEVHIVDTLELKSKKKSGKTANPADEEAFRKADDLDDPIRSADSMRTFDAQRAHFEEKQHDAPPGTLVIRAQVVDYAKGNKLLQLSQLDLGNSILTLRFSYFDKETGEEIGRSVISSDNSSKILPSVLSTRTIMSGVAEGVVDQITRRQVAAERSWP